MWTTVDRLLHQKPAPPARVPEPVRKPSMNLTTLAPGSIIRFAASCPLPQLASKRAEVQSVRTYCFGTDVTVSYQLAAGGETCFLTVAEDEQGYYLALARELSPLQQDVFFGRDALGFFTEHSSARTIRCKADFTIEGAWLGERYSKIVDWAAGTITQGRLSTAGASKQTRQFHYNQLVDESGEKTLEIEHFEDGGFENRVYITVYRPVEDIDSIAEPMPHIPAPASAAIPRPQAAKPSVAAPLSEIKEEIQAINGHANGHTAAPAVEPALFAENGKHARTDFRRISEEEALPIHIGRPPQAEPKAALPAELPPLPSFLLSRENSYMSLDEIITPETENIRCDLISAKLLIDTALKRRIHVKDILRELLGLESSTKDEAVFELPLTDADYRTLAMRYRLKPDRRDDIRLCLQEELRLKLLAIAKT